MEENKKNGILLIVIIAVVFGLASGVVGELVARVYIFENAFNIPFFGEINLSGNSNGGSNLVIRGAKKVVVEQDVKINETVNSLNNSLVGIFNKIATTSLSSKTINGKQEVFDVNKGYKINEEVAQGFIITSDGWIISSYFPPGLKQLQLLADKEAQKNKKKLLNDYIVITKGKKLFLVDDIIYDEYSSYAFWHVNASDLPVKKFASENEVHNGQLAIAVNWDGWAHLTTITGRNGDSSALVQSSDEFIKEIVLSESPGKEFNGSFLFNLNSDLVGLIGDKGEIESIINFNSVINSLLKKKDIKRASLGVNYIDLSSFIYPSASGYEKGALIYKDNKGISVIEDSPADLAGIKEGDIIITVDNIEVNKDNSLSSIVGNRIIGEEIDIVLIRGDEKKIVKAVLSEMEK